MNLIKEEGDLLLVQCNLCKKEFTIEKKKCIKTSEGYELKEKIKCNICGEIDSSIVNYRKMLKFYNMTEKKRNLRTFESEKKAQVQNSSIKNQIRCPKCGSTQITSNNKGFSVGKAVGGLALFGQVGLLGGFLGSKKVVVTCLKCGNQWKAGKL
ncbi:hypothetical protein JMF89_01230 [Clostridiaceae bacterium UIB06]|uniref:Uncharacterized protein n=1 Tax=Clostridium thailandense TaxID=2794346 RepID=A0A949U413_9CLOT|nr:hypothetical protein [Clostridium thailandense]MBV7276058.1 hypothetical protein [Clostridium thailandense]MCH5135837.1 hypothetical protein [Clostridiaceae bacterium UIB06]